MFTSTQAAIDLAVDLGIDRLEPLVLIIAGAAALGMFVWSGLATASMFTKMGISGWKGWVPIVREVSILRAGGENPKMMWLVLIPLLGWIFIAVLLIFAFNRIARGFGRGGGLTLLYVLFPTLAITLLAVSRAGWSGPAQQAPVAPAGHFAPPVMPVPPVMPMPPVMPEQAGVQWPPSHPVPAVQPGQADNWQAPPQQQVGQVYDAPTPYPAPAGAPVEAPMAQPWSPWAPEVPATPTVPADEPAPTGPPVAQPIAPQMPVVDAQPVPVVAEAVVPVVAEAAAVPVVAEAVPQMPVVDAQPVPVVAEVAVPAVAEVAAVPVVAEAAVPVVADSSPQPEASAPVDESTVFGTAALAAAAAAEIDESTVFSRRLPVIKWFISTADEAQKYELEGDLILVGRRPEQLDEFAGAQLLAVKDSGRTVSKLHAVIRRSENGWTIEDLQSVNGVTLVGEDDTERLIPAGEPERIERRFFLGDVEFILEDEISL